MANIAPAAVDDEPVERTLTVKEIPIAVERKGSIRDFGEARGINPLRARIDKCPASTKHAIGRQRKVTLPFVPMGPILGHQRQEGGMVIPPSGFDRGEGV